MDVARLPAPAGFASLDPHRKAGNLREDLARLAAAAPGLIPARGTYMATHRWGARSGHGTQGGRVSTGPHSAPAADGARHPGKRAFDLAVLILVALPALALGSVCALAILLTDGSPVLFREVRAGRGGRPFVVLKLRSMTAAGLSDDVLPRFGQDHPGRGNPASVVC